MNDNLKNLQGLRLIIPKTSNENSRIWSFVIGPKTMP